MTTYTQKITFGEMRASGVRDVLIYCRTGRVMDSFAWIRQRWLIVYWPPS